MPGMLPLALRELQRQIDEERHRMASIASGHDKFETFLDYLKSRQHLEVNIHSQTIREVTVDILERDRAAIFDTETGTSPTYSFGEIEVVQRKKTHGELPNADHLKRMDEFGKYIRTQQRLNVSTKGRVIRRASVSGITTSWARLNPLDGSAPTVVDFDKIESVEPTI